MLKVRGKMKKYIIIMLGLVLFLGSCKEKTGNSPTSVNQNKVIKQNIDVPEFNADSAWKYVENQVKFGARVPNTKAHDNCGDYLSGFFKELGAEVIEQKTRVKAYNNQFLNITNIIAQFNPEKKNRIILCAHWDTRPYADHDVDSTLWNKAIDGANDGGSGVGVLMEIGRQINLKPINIGIDIILFDAEDYGEPDFDPEYYPGDFWCLGSQYWSANPHIRGYYAKYAILLDMVGAPNALFAREGVSMKYASNIVNKVWGAAARLGYENHFIKENTQELIDDHLYLNEIAHIPSIDIVQYDPDSESYFGSFWHTHDDNMSGIDKGTLKAVGQTVLQVIYEEK